MSVPSHCPSQYGEASALRETGGEMPWNLDTSWSLDTEQCGLSSCWVDPQMETPSYVNWYQPLIQGSALFEHPDEMNAMVSMTEEFNSEALFLLGECVNASVNLDRTDYREKILSQLENLTVERYDGELAEYVEKLNGRSKLEPAFQLLRFSVYLSSNNLLSEAKTDRLVKWINKSGTQRVLYRLLDLKTPTTEIFGSNILVSAARLGFIDIVRSLITKGVEINALAGDIFRRTALQEAVRYDHFRIVEVLLDAGADPRPQIGLLRSVLHDALGGPNNYDTVQMLIKNGADVNGPFDETFYKATVLASAALRHDCAMARILLAAGARINEMPKFSTTALQASAGCEDIDTAQLLIDGGADIDAPAGRTYTEACKAAAKEDHFRLLTTPIQRASIANNTELVQILVCEGADVNACPWENYIERVCLAVAEDESDTVRTALQAAVANNNAVLVRVLLRADANIDARGCPFTALQIAAGEANVKIVGILLKQGADINAPANTPNGSTALQAAASTDNCELVQLLLDASADVNGAASPSGGRTALQAATEHGNIDIAKILIGAGANINANASSVDGRTCLQAAAEKGHAELVQLLLDKGADVNSPAAIVSGGLTALQAALTGFSEICRPEDRISKEHAWTTIIRALLDAGADVNAPPSPREGVSTLEAAVATKRPGPIRSLILRGIDPNLYVKSNSAIMEAVFQESTELLLLLIKAGADINVCCNNDRRFFKADTALEAAASIGSIPITRILLDAAAELDDHAHQLASRTALHMAVRRNSIELVQLLLTKGANPNAHSENISIPSTALEEALSRWSINIDIISILLDAGADANKIARPRAHHPLRQAAANGCVEAVRMLLKAGARPDFTSEDKETVLQAAVESRNVDLIQILINAGADINAPAGPIRGRTALQRAAELGDTKMVKFLLSHNADLNAPAAHSYGITALQGAVIGGHLKIVLMLLKAGAEINAPSAKVEGRMALDVAVEHGRLDTVLLLLKNDDDAEAIGLRCKRAAKLAASNGHHVIMRILREHSVSRDPTT